MAAERARRIGKRIRELREEKGWTQAQLANKLEEQVTSTYVSRWERGEHEPLGDRLDSIAVALGTSTADLMAGPLAEREPPPDETADLMGALNGSRTEPTLAYIVERLATMESRVATEAARNAEMRSQIDLLVARSEPGASGGK